MGMARVRRLPQVRRDSSGETRSPYTTRFTVSDSQRRAGSQMSAARAAAPIERSSSVRSEPSGVRLSASTTTAYTPTTRAVRPAKETVWVKRRSTRATAWPDVLAVRARGTTPVAATAQASGLAGCSVSALSAITTSTASAPTASAQPTHCMRRRSVAPAAW